MKDVGVQTEPVSKGFRRSDVKGTRDSAELEPISPVSKGFRRSDVKGTRNSAELEPMPPLDRSLSK